MNMLSRDHWKDLGEPPAHPDQLKGYQLVSLFRRPSDVAKNNIMEYLVQPRASGDIHKELTVEEEEANKPFRICLHNIVGEIDPLFHVQTCWLRSERREDYLFITGIVIDTDWVERIK